MWEEIGRIIKTLLIFDPVETGTLEQSSSSYLATLFAATTDSYIKAGINKAEKIAIKASHHPVVQGVEELQTAQGVSEFVQGFANGTSILAGPEAALCTIDIYSTYGGLNEIISNITYLADSSNDDRSEFQIYHILHNMWYLAWNSHPLQ